MGGVALAPFASLAQQSGKVWRIGVLQAGTKKYFVTSGFQKNFLQGMREHGYVPERDFITLERFADGDLSRGCRGAVFRLSVALGCLVRAKSEGRDLDGPDPLDGAFFDGRAIS